MKKRLVAVEIIADFPNPGLKLFLITSYFNLHLKKIILQTTKIFI